MRKAAVIGAFGVAIALSGACGGGPSGVSKPRRPEHRVTRVSGVATSPQAAASRRRLLLGRSSVGGRPIAVIHAGDPHGTRVLVFGCIHGTECAGIPITRGLEHVHSHAADLWIVPNLNPDGYARGTRQNGRGVDLNANWSSQWHGGGHPWDTYYPGPRPFSERPHHRVAFRGRLAVSKTSSGGVGTDSGLSAAVIMRPEVVHRDGERDHRGDGGPRIAGI